NNRHFAMVTVDRFYVSGGTVVEVILLSLTNRFHSLITSDDHVRILSNLLYRTTLRCSGLLLRNCGIELPVRYWPFEPEALPVRSAAPIARDPDYPSLLVPLALLGASVTLRPNNAVAQSAADGLLSLSMPTLLHCPQISSATSSP